MLYFAKTTVTYRRILGYLIYWNAIFEVNFPWSHSRLFTDFNRINYKYYLPSKNTISSISSLCLHSLSACYSINNNLNVSHSSKSIHILQNLSCMSHLNIEKQYCIYNSVMSRAYDGSFDRMVGEQASTFLCHDHQCSNTDVKWALVKTIFCSARQWGVLVTVRAWTFLVPRFAYAQSPSQGKTSPLYNILDVIFPCF